MARSVAASFDLKQSAPRRFITLFALLAFFLQGLALQGHLHQSFPAPSAITAVSDLPAPAKKTDPSDQSHCRLCHELGQAGAFVAPTASALPAHLNFVAAIFIALPLLSDAFAPAFAWQSRAPPRH
jgi:hypothetical protein